MSYASQATAAAAAAAQGAPGSSAANSGAGLSSPLYASNLASSLASRGLNAGLSSDDFPALGGVAQGNGEYNGNGSAGVLGGAAVNRAPQAPAGEQASAAAALHAQHAAREAHRLSLLGSMNAGAAQQPLNAARGGFGELDRNYANKLGAGPPPPGMTGWSTGPNGLPGTAASVQQSQQGAVGGAPSLVQPSNATGDDAVQTSAQQVLHSPADRFGLLGLLHIIKMQDPDAAMLSMGTDLQTLGLSMEAQDALYSSFITPWAENSMAASMQVEPDFHLPSCYNVQATPPARNKVSGFTDETLFYIFYSTPRDVLQEVAAQELHTRNWRFHRELQLWLTQNGEPTQKTPTYERGSYIFFDPRAWEKVSKEFVLMYELLEEKPPQSHMSMQQQQQQATATQQAQVSQQQQQAAAPQAPR